MTRDDMVELVAKAIDSQGLYPDLEAQEWAWRIVDAAIALHGPIHELFLMADESTSRPTMRVVEAICEALVEVGNQAQAQAEQDMGLGTWQERAKNPREAVNNV